MSDFEDDPVIDPFSHAYSGEYGEGKTYATETDDGLAMLGGVVLFMAAFLITVGVAFYVWVL